MLYKSFWRTLYALAFPRPDEVTYSTLIHGLSKAGDNDGAWEVRGTGRGGSNASEDMMYVPCWTLL